MSPGREAWLAGRREVRERLRSRAFRISTVIQVLAVIAIAVVSSVVGGGATTVEIGYVGAQGKAVLDRAEVGQEALDLKLEPKEYASLDSARDAIAGDDIEAAAAGRANLVASNADEGAEALLRQAADTIERQRMLMRMGLTKQQIGAVEAARAPGFETVEVSGGSGGSGIALIATLLLYVALIFAGYSVSSGVTEEKSTRVVELVINAIKPSRLLAGKVVGIGLMGFAQLFLIILFGLGTALAIGSVELPSGTAETAILALAYFVLGYGLYGCAFAVSGALVSRQEDIQSSTAPVMILLVAAYVISISVIDNPGSTLAVVATLVPPIAPMVVPARAAAGELPLDQLLASLALMVVGSLLLIRLAGKVYERTVLRMGAPVRLREVPAMLRSRE